MQNRLGRRKEGDGALAAVLQPNIGGGTAPGNHVDAGGPAGTSKDSCEHKVHAHAGGEREICHA